MIFKRKGKRDQKDENTIFVTIDGNKMSVPSDIAQKSELKTDKTEAVVRIIIDGKLYDTSKATKICTMCIPKQEIPSGLHPTGILGCLDGYSVDLYRGKQAFFCVFCKRVFVVSNEWVEKWLGICNADKYIEMFGEPELA